MISFPRLFPDELLYSAFSRYHRNSGNENHRHTMDQLFGNSTACASLLFPSNLDELCDRMPIGSTYTPECFITNNSFHPYYAPFIPERRSIEVQELMKGENGGSIYMKIGLPASSLKVRHGLKYCPECINQDRKAYGEAYWHRTHQAEGVLVCPLHSLLLVESGLKHNQQRNKHEYISLEIILQSEEVEVNSTLLDQSNPLLFIAHQTYLLLNHNFKSMGLERINRYYISKLQRMGLANHNGKIKWEKLISAFTCHYGKECLIKLQSYVELASADTWLHKLLRKPRFTCHPLRHLLLLGFLDVTVAAMNNELENGYSFYEHFGKGPWPCLNKAADHFSENVINNCETSRCSKSGLPIGTFSCSCGFVYSRRGPDQCVDDRYKVGRIKVFGQVWDTLFHELVTQDISIRSIADRLGCHPQTIHNKKLESNRAFHVKEIKDGIEYKNQWKALRETNKALFVTEIRRLIPAAYKWLYMNDKEWLHEHSPQAIKKKAQKKVNWMDRDKELAEEVQNAAEEILDDNNKQMRATKSEIGRRIGKLSLIINNLGQLPRTKRKLNAVIETVEEFQARRIQSVAAEIMKENRTIKEWELLRLAGIRKEYVELHRVILSSLGNKN